MMRLDRFTTAGFDRGASRSKEALWLFCQGLLLASWMPGSRMRVVLLRLFGARIGVGVVIKPHVRVKFPWRLRIGDHSWIGESVWIDNLTDVAIGSHCCISQGVYLCTGSHDAASEGFDLITQPVTIGDRVWLCAHVLVAPGCEITSGAVVAMGSIALGALGQPAIYAGQPAVFVKMREST